MRYYADTNIGVVRIEESAGTFVVTREGLQIFRTRYLLALTDWLEFHRGILREARTP